MKHCKCILLFFLLFKLNLLCSQITPIDSLRIMTYNTLNYGVPASVQCPDLLTGSKTGYLKTILRYTDPDILGLVKMNADSSFVTDSISQNVLDSVCLGCYGHVQYTNQSGYTRSNMLYFKTNKIGFVSTTTIYSVDPNISDINLHKLYYKSADLATTHDTIFLNIIQLHLKSGNNWTERGAEISGTMYWLNQNILQAGNYILMGDMNTLSSYESCFQQLITSANIYTQFIDPPNQLGDWSTTPLLYANYLTHSTRINDIGDCAALGGLNSRFDHILLTQPLITGANNVQYMSNSYNVLGQDGKHTHVSLIDTPANVSVTNEVLNALYNMSNHLPVLLKVAIYSSPITSINASGVNEFSNSISVYPNPANNSFTIKGNALPNENCTLTLVNTLGQTVKTKEFKTTNSSFEIKIDSEDIPAGLYFLNIHSAFADRKYKIQIQ